jgi:hypothetical protein
MFFVLLLASLAFPTDPVDEARSYQPPSTVVMPRTRADVVRELERAYRAGEMTARGEIDTTPR